METRENESTKGRRDEKNAKKSQRIHSAGKAYALNEPFNYKFNRHNYIECHRRKHGKAV